LLSGWFSCIRLLLLDESITSMSVSADRGVTADLCRDGLALSFDSSSFKELETRAVVLTCSPTPASAACFMHNRTWDGGITQQQRSCRIKCDRDHFLIHDLLFLPISTIESAVGKRLITHCCASRLACSLLSGHIEPHSPRLQS